LSDLQDTAMDSIRKKMQSMKAEIDDMYQMIAENEAKTNEANAESDRYDAEIRDLSKKVLKQDTRMEETLEEILASSNKIEHAEGEFKEMDDDVNAQNRRVLLLEEEGQICMGKLANTIMKLSLMSKDADIIIKKARQWENNTMNNEMELENLDKNVKDARKIGSDNESKYDNLARSLSMMESEGKRAAERVKLAEERVKSIEDDLQSIGENQKMVEVSVEKAIRREEKYQSKIKQIEERLKLAETRSEYAEKNISKLHHRIDELEDEIIREKMKINAVSDQLNETFIDMLTKY